MSGTSIQRSNNVRGLAFRGQTNNVCLPSTRKLLLSNVMFHDIVDVFVSMSIYRLHLHSSSIFCMTYTHSDYIYIFYSFCLYHICRFICANNMSLSASVAVCVERPASIKLE